VCDFFFKALLWLNMAQSLREDRWFPDENARLPPEVQIIVDTASAAGMNLIPYIYPILGWHTADPSWRQDPSNNNSFCTLEHQEYNDFYVDTIAAFSALSGARGAGFDFTYLINSNASNYAQWYGWRRVLRGIRKAAWRANPGATYVVDNRQANHQWGPFMWAAGSYAEPMQSDEQPESWQAVVPDPSTDRCSANHMRRMNYLYMMTQMCPPSAMPGFAHHQTDRYLVDGTFVRNADLHARDYDYFGSTYALLSSIASGGLNNVVCMIPARDEGEFAAFPADAGATQMSVAFYRTWFAWADAHMPHLRASKFLPVPPAELDGGVDGSYMVLGNEGFLFLFNAQSAANASMALTLDASLDFSCAAGDAFLLAEMWPVPRNLSTYACGASFAVAVEGRSATVFTLAPAPALAEARAEAEAEASRSLMLVGRAARAGARAELVAGGATVELSGEFADFGHASAADNTNDACGVAPLYVHVPLALARSVSRVALARRARAPGLELELELAFEDVTSRAPAVAPRPAGRRGARAAPRAAQLLSARCPPGTASAPAPLPGHALLAVTAARGGGSSGAGGAGGGAGSAGGGAGAGGFVRSQAVQGMDYDATFAGGVLAGTVSVPQAVFDQLAARAALYPVPWSADDLAVSWLNPARLLAFVDDGRALPRLNSSTPMDVAAALDGAAVPVLPSWNCRGTQSQACFLGRFIDLTAAGVREAGRNYSLVLTLPPMPAGAFQRVVYDNVETVFAAL